MISTAVALFVTNGLTLKKSGRLWIYPSQAKQLELLNTRHNIGIADRTLRYHHYNFKHAGLTIRKRRWDRQEDGTIYMLTTGMAYTIAGYRLLLSLGHPWVKERIERLIQKYGPRSDSAKKPLKYIQIPAPEASPKKPGKSPFLDPELRKRKGLKPLPPFGSKTK